MPSPPVVAISAPSTRRFGERRGGDHPYRRSYTVQHMVQPSASYSITMRVRLPQQPGSFGRVASAIGETGGILGAIDLVRVESGVVVRDVTVSCADDGHGRAVVDEVASLDGITVES